MLRLLLDEDPRVWATEALGVAHSTDGPAWRARWFTGHTEGQWVGLNGPILAHRAGLLPKSPPESSLDWGFGELHSSDPRADPSGPNRHVIAHLLQVADTWLEDLESVLVVHSARVPSVIAASGLHRLLLLELVRVMAPGRDNLGILVGHTPGTEPAGEGTYEVSDARAWQMPGLSFHSDRPDVSVGRGDHLRELDYGDLDLEPWLLEARMMGN